VQALDLMVGIFREELEKAGRLRDTLIALTGDNGAPGFPHGKTQLYDFGSRAPLVICWPGHIKAGRAVNDFVNLMDLAPTFLEAAGVKPPKTMDAKSLLPELLSPENGWIVSARDTAIYGRSRHFIQARPGNLPYSSRAVRTRDFLYIRNFNPDRWPFGDPFGLASASPIGFNELADYGWLDRAPFRDMDPSLTKAWLVVHRNESVGHELYAHAFDLRPAEELYNLRVDPVQIHNVAASPQYAGQLHQLAEHLMSVLQETHDPVLNGAFDKPPYVEKKELQPRKME